MNINTDVISCVLTAIYVVCTIGILIFNPKTADAAHKQIEEARKIQEGNVALQLLNQRIEIYSTLNTWVENASAKNNYTYEKNLFLSIFCNAKNEGIGTVKVISELKEQSKIIELAEVCFFRSDESDESDYEIIKKFSDAYMESAILIGKYITNSNYKYCDSLEEIIKNIKEVKILENLKEITKNIVKKEILRNMKEEMKKVKIV